MHVDPVFITQVAVPLGCLFLTGWQFARANRYRQQLAEAHALRYEEWRGENQKLSERLLSETGTATVDELVKNLRQLNYRLGYALHHIEQFEASPLLKSQLVTIASKLRTNASHPVFNRPLSLDKVAGTGGFREMEARDEYEVEWETTLLVDGLNSWQLAGICCYIMDGYHLEGAFYKVGITIYSPTGKATALGQKYLNKYGAKVCS